MSVINPKIVKFSKCKGSHKNNIIIHSWYRDDSELISEIGEGTKFINAKEFPDNEIEAMLLGNENITLTSTVLLSHFKDNFEKQNFRKIMDMTNVYILEGV